MLEYSSVIIHKLIPLAGPDRLLRISFSLPFESYMMEDTLDQYYNAVSYIINGCLLQKHSLTSEIDKETFFSWMHTDEGDPYEGIVRIELLIRKKQPSEVQLNYYPEELELARKFFEIESFYKINTDIDPETYPRAVTLNDLREGAEQFKDTFLVKVKKT